MFKFEKARAAQLANIEWLPPRLDVDYTVLTRNRLAWNSVTRVINYEI